MPAPKFLSFLPKPLLFGLYGGVGGLLGALLFGELLWFVLGSVLLKPPAPVVPVPQLAVAASKDVEVFVEGRNTFPVQIARDGFTGPVTVRVEGLPAGVTAEPVVIPEGKTEGEVVVVGARNARVGVKPAMAVAEATHDGKKITAEPQDITFKVTDPPRPLADVVFVLDVSVSMQWAIDELKSGIGKFADAMDKSRIDFRLGLVTFRDLTQPGEKAEVMLFETEPFTAARDLFRDRVGTLKPSGGGPDIPDSSLEGVGEACKMPFREKATKMLLLITDGAPKVVPESDTAKRVGTTAQLIAGAKIDSAHVVAWRFDKDVYAPLTEAGVSPGRHFDIWDVVAGDEGFDALLKAFGGVVSAAAIAKNPDSKPQVATKAAAPTLGVKSLQTSEQSAAGTEWKVVVRSGVWTGAVAALVCLALLAGQHHYLRGSLPAVAGVAVGFLGGLAVGLFGGAAGQGLYFLAPDNITLARIFLVVGWVLLGGLAGAGLSLFVPNMKWTLGLAGGAVGGAAGAVAFIVASAAVGNLAGRLAGGLALGFGIGLMVAVAEAAFRRAWLEVRYGGRETIAVTLGPEPVKVGSDAKACTVWAQGAPAIALRFFLRDGQVICDDPIQKRETTAADGFAKEVGNLTVTVRTGSGTPAAAAPPRAAPVAKKPAAMDLDNDDLNLPMPVAPSPPPKPGAPPKAIPPKPAASAPPKPPVPARPPAPSANPAPAPPAAPAIKSTAKNPDACPGCSRVIPGRPGQRYCMICDQTF